MMGEIETEKVPRIFSPKTWRIGIFALSLQPEGIKDTIMEATTARRRRTVKPITKAWNLAKKLDNSEKLELVAMLIDSVRVVKSTQDEEFADMDKELYTPEEAYDLTMKDIKAIYADAAV